MKSLTLAIILAGSILGCGSDTRPEPVTPVHGISGTFEKIEAFEDFGSTISLVFDSFGNPNVVYRDAGRLESRFASRSGTGWTVETIIRGDHDSGEIALALDASNAPAVAYQVITGNLTSELHVVRRVSAGWVDETVDRSGWSGSWSSLAFDRAGTLHAAYFQGYPGYDLRYGVREAGGWRTEEVDTNGETGYGARLVLTPDDHPRIACAELHSGVRLAGNDGAGWIVENVASAHFATGAIAMTLDGRSVPVVAFVALDRTPAAYDTDYDLRLSTPASPGWSTETIESAAFNPSLAVSPDGEIWLAYRAAGANRDPKGTLTLTCLTDVCPSHFTVEGTGGTENAVIAFAPDGSFGVAFHRGATESEPAGMYFGTLTIER